MNYTKTYKVRVPIKTVYDFKIIQITTKETDTEKIMEEAVGKFYRDVSKEECIVNVDILEDNDKKEFIERI